MDENDFKIPISTALTFCQDVELVKYCVSNFYALARLKEAVNFRTIQGEFNIAVNGLELQRIIFPDV